MDGMGSPATEEPVVWWSIDGDGEDTFETVTELFDRAKIAMA
jgi:hypothetical protein